MAIQKTTTVQMELCIEKRICLQIGGGDVEEE
jgi:hypothetical protein